MEQWNEVLHSGIWVVVAVCGYWLVPPLLILVTYKMHGSPEVVEFDPDVTPPPTSVARYFAENRTTLEDCGFRRLASVVLPDPTPNVKAVLELFVNDQNQDAAMVSAFFVTGVGAASPPKRYVEFATEFPGGEFEELQTSNNIIVGAYPDLTKSPTFRFPHVTDVEQLYRLHQALLEREAGGSRKVLLVLDEFGGDVSEYLRVKVFRGCCERHVGTGYLRYNEPRDCFVATVFGAYLMSWKQMWPTKWIIQAGYARDGKRLERKLDLSLQ